MIEREGRIKISAQTTGQEQIAGMSKALGDMEGAANRAGEGFSKMGSVVSGLSFAAWNQGLQLGIQLLSDAYRSLDDYSNLSMKFKGNIHELTAAVEHEIGAIDLMRGQNRLLLADIKLTDKQYADLAIAVNKIAEATGKDGAQALEAFTASIERGSERGLKQLGIMVDLKSAQEEYARELGKGVKDLSEVEKAQALFNVSLEATQDKAKSAGDGVETYTDRSEKGLNKIKDKLLEIMDLVNRGKEDEAFSALWRGYVGVTNKVWNDVGDAAGEIYGAAKETFELSSPKIAKANRLSKGRDDYEAGIDSEGARQYRQEMAWQLDRGGGGAVPLTGEGADQYGSGETLYQRYGADTKLRRDEKAAEARAAAKKKRSRTGGGQKKEPEIQAWEMDLQDMAAEDALWQKDYDEQQKKDAKAQEMNDKADAQWRVGQIKQEQALDQQLDKIRQQEKKVRDENTKLAKSMGVDLGKAAQFAGNDINKLNVYLTDLSDKTKQVDADMQGIAMGGLKKMAEGLVMSVDAAVSGSDSFGAAMAKMTQSVLHNMAIEYGIKAVLAFGEALWMTATLNPGATVMYQAAAQFAVGAGMAGAGAALVGAGVSSGGTGSSTSAVKSRETAARGGSSTSSKSWGKKEENNQPITVNLYLGDKGDPSAALYMRKQIEAQIKKAA